MLRYNKCPTDKSGNGYRGNKYVLDEETIVFYLFGKVGHMRSKCRHLPRIGSSNAFGINKKRPKKIEVPKENIIHVVDIFKHNNHGT